MSHQVGRGPFNVQRQVNVVDTVTRLAGGHQLRFWADYRYLYPLVAPNLVSQLITFPNVATAANSPPSGTKDKPIHSVNGVDDYASMTLAPPGTPMYQTTYNNIAPRVGVSYQLSQELAVGIDIQGWLWGDIRQKPPSAFVA